jgi:hypothetical protein
MKSPTLPDFLEAHRPKHREIEAMQTMAAQADRAEGLRGLQAHFTGTVEPPQPPKTLLERYMHSILPIQQDALERPPHYDTRQHEIIHLLCTGGGDSVSAREQDELFLTYLQNSDLAKQTQERNRRLSAPRDPDADADIQAFEQELSGGPTFEKQDFGGTIDLL